MLLGSPSSDCQTRTDQAELVDSAPAVAVRRNDAASSQ